MYSCHSIHFMEYITKKLFKFIEDVIIKQKMYFNAPAHRSDVLKCSHEWKEKLLESEQRS